MRLNFILDYSSNNYDRSGTSTPSIVNPQKQAPPKHPPMFITVSFINRDKQIFEAGAIKNSEPPNF